MALHIIYFHTIFISLNSWTVTYNYKEHIIFFLIYVKNGKITLFITRREFVFCALSYGDNIYY